MTDTLLRQSLDPNTRIYNRLKAALRLNLRRQIFVAICDDLALRDRLADQLQKEVTYAAISARRRGQLAEARRLRIYPRLVTLNLDLADPNPINQMSQWLRQFPPPAAAGSAMPAFQLLGIEQLSRQPASSQWLFLNHLQAVERNLAALESSLLLWVPRPWGRMIPQSAPDFWRCRTAVFEFAGEPTPLPAASLPQSTVPTSIFLQPQRQHPLPPASASTAANLSPDEVALLRSELATPSSTGVPLPVPPEIDPADTNQPQLPAAEDVASLPSAASDNSAEALQTSEPVLADLPAPQADAVTAPPTASVPHLPTAQAEDLGSALRDLLDDADTAASSNREAATEAIAGAEEPVANPFASDSLAVNGDNDVLAVPYADSPYVDVPDPDADVPTTDAPAASVSSEDASVEESDSQAIAPPPQEAIGAEDATAPSSRVDPSQNGHADTLDTASVDATLDLPPLDGALDFDQLEDPFDVDLSPSDSGQLDPFDLDLDAPLAPPLEVSDAPVHDPLLDDAVDVPGSRTSGQDSVEAPLPQDTPLPVADGEDAELTVANASPDYAFGLSERPAQPVPTDTSHDDLVRFFTEGSDDPRVLNVLQQIQGLLQQQAPPMVLAGAYRALGNLFRDRIEKGEISPSTLQMAMVAYQQVLRWASEKSPMRAEVLNDMGNLSWLLSRCSQGPEQALPHLHQSIQAYQEALTHIAPDTHPQTYPMIQNNLGAAYGDLARYQNPPENLQKSIQAYQEALHYRNAEQDPMRYASTQNNLGTTYWNLAQHQEPIQHLKAAIAAYDSALTYYNPAQDALNYAMIQNNLGTAYWNLAQHEHSEEWLRQAIQAYNLALEYRTLESAPAAFAATQNNLGTAHWHIANYIDETPEARFESLQQAMRAYEAALQAVDYLQKVDRPTALNFDVTATQNNLGLVQYQTATDSEFDTAKMGEAYLSAALDHHLAALNGWQGRPELRQTALNCVIQTLQAIYAKKGLVGQNLALAKVPGQLLPEILPKL